MAFYKILLVPGRWNKLAIHLACAIGGGAVASGGNALLNIVASIGLDPVYATAIGAVIADVVRQLTLEIHSLDPGIEPSDVLIPPTVDVSPEA